MYKNISYLLIALFIVNISYSQKKDKIKGSKIITLTIKELENFETIEIRDNFEVTIVKSEKPSIEIEADDNLHDIVNYEVKGTTLAVSTLKEPIGFKKFLIRINYNDSLKLIVVRDAVEIKALADLSLDNITVKGYDASKIFLNVKSNYFALQLDDKCEAEINVKADKTSVELSKNSEIKALVVSTEFKLDMYQKSSAVIEGTTSKAKIRLDNMSTLKAQKLVVNNLEIDCDNYSKCEINVGNSVAISAAGKSQIELYGEPKISIEKLTNNATLYKKEKK